MYGTLGQSWSAEAWHARLSVALPKDIAPAFSKLAECAASLASLETPTGEKTPRIFCGRLLPRLAVTASRPGVVLLEELVTVHRESRMSRNRSRTL